MKSFRSGLGFHESCPEHEAEFDLALHTGMRRGEQYLLRWQDIDFNTGTGIITIRRSKNGEARYIQINSIARAALIQLKQRRDSVGYVCPGFEGPRNKDRRRWFDKVLEETKISNFRWHDLRHTFASRLVMAGVPLRSVQVVLGHKQIETTLRYSHLSESHLQEAVERLSIYPTDTSTDTGATSANCAFQRSNSITLYECMVPKRGLEPPLPCGN